MSGSVRCMFGRGGFRRNISDEAGMGGLWVCTYPTRPTRPAIKVVGSFFFTTWSIVTGVVKSTFVPSHHCTYCT